MSTSARVDDIDPLKEFRAYLIKFKELAGMALGDADSELQRIESWLEGDQQNYWTGQIRKRTEIVSRCEEAYRQKKIYKDSSGSTPSAVDEQKALMIAKKNLVEAQQKLANVKQWARRLQKEVILYRGGVARFSNDVSAGVPHAIAHLTSTIEMLEKYLDVEPVGAGGTGGEGVAAGGVGAESGRGTMARAPDEMPPPAEPAPVDPAALRSAVPKDELLGDPVLLAIVSLACGAVTPEQRTQTAGMQMDQMPGAEETVIMSAGSAWAERVFLLRGLVGGIFAWFVGSVDAPADTVYNKATVAQLRAARPDFADLLKLPAESLMILDKLGLAEIYNSSNENILPPPADDAEAK